MLLDELGKFWVILKSSEFCFMDLPEKKAIIFELFTIREQISMSRPTHLLVDFQIEYMFFRNPSVYS